MIVAALLLLSVPPITAPIPAVEWSCKETGGAERVVSGRFERLDASFEHPIPPESANPAFKVSSDEAGLLSNALTFGTSDGSHYSTEIVAGDTMKFIEFDFESEEKTLEISQFSGGLQEDYFRGDCSVRQLSEERTK